MDNETYIAAIGKTAFDGPFKQCCEPLIVGANNLYPQNNLNQFITSICGGKVNFCQVHTHSGRYVCMQGSQHFVAYQKTNPCGLLVPVQTLTKKMEEINVQVYCTVTTDLVQDSTYTPSFIPCNSAETKGVCSMDAMVQVFGGGSVIRWLAKVLIIQCCFPLGTPEHPSRPACWHSTYLCFAPALL